MSFTKDKSQIYVKVKYMYWYSLGEGVNKNFFQFLHKNISQSIEGYS